MIHDLQKNWNNCSKPFIYNNTNEHVEGVEKCNIWYQVKVLKPQSNKTILGNLTLWWHDIQRRSFLELRTPASCAVKLNLQRKKQLFLVPFVFLLQNCGYTGIVLKGSINFKYDTVIRSLTLCLRHALFASVNEWRPIL